MTPPPGPAGTTTPAKPDTEDQSGEVCSTCRHLWQNHDRIAVRYCTATSNASDPSGRGCVCTTREN